MRIVDISLQHMTDVVTTCIVLHNICTIRKKKFNMECIEES